MDVDSAIAQFLSNLTVERRLSRNTVNAYRRDLTLFQAELTAEKRSDIEDITKLDVRRFDYLGGAMAEIDPRALIFDALDPWAEPWPKSIPEA